jgi:hypothetical protein
MPWNLMIRNMYKECLATDVKTLQHRDGSIPEIHDEIGGEEAVHTVE